MKSKFSKVAFAISLVATMIVPSVAHGQTSISDLQAQIAALQAQLAALSGSTTTSSYNFTQNLTVGSTGADVTALQNILISGGFLKISAATGYFGTLTKAALAAWQASAGVSPAVGYFGPISRAKLAASGSTTPVATLPAGCTSTVGFSSTTGAKCDGTTAPVTSALTVSLASDTPAATTIADSGNMNFTKFNITSGASALTVSSITVTRIGLSANADLENVKILDANGVRLSNTASLNSNSQAKLTFTPALSIPANTTQAFYIRAGIVAATVGGKTVGFSINAASDISASETLTGSFPINGNLSSTVLLAIGTVTLEEDGSVNDSSPDVGDVDVITNKFKISAGSEEDVTIEQIQVERKGTASSDDTASIELYNVTSSATVATVATWDARGLATFNNLGIKIAKGNNIRFEIRIDVVDGASLTINTDLTDGSDARVVAKGDKYGFYITPGITWTPANGGQGDSAQTVSAGALTITKSSSTPATGNVTKGNDRLIAVFDVIVNGEAVQVTSFQVGFELATMLDSEISNARIRNFTTGAILGGPNTVDATDVVGNTTTYNTSATFTDVMNFSVGTTKVGVYVDIADAVSAGDTIFAGVPDADTDVVAKGITSNDTITAAPAASDVDGNTLTVQAGALAATTLTTPAARSVVVGTNDFLWSEIELSAANSGEDINITALVLEDTLNLAASDADDINNVEIWADLTSANSARGDRYETKVSNTLQFADSGATDETLSVTLTQTIKVPKDTAIRIAVIADLAAGATAAETHAISLDTDSGDVTANGATTGTSVTLTPAGAGQAMTVDAAGTLTVSVDASSPSAKLVLDDMQGGKELLAIFRLAASNEEALELDSFKITDDGNDRAVDEYFFQAKSKTGTNLGVERNIVGGATAEVFWADGDVTIPSNDFIRVYVYGYTRDIDASAAVNEDTVVVTVAAAGDVDTTGLSSGTAVDSTQTSVDANTHELFQAYPTFAWQTLTNTTLSGSANHLVGKLKITAVGDEDVSFLSGSTSNIVFQFTSNETDSDAATTAVTFKDNAGTTLDTATPTVGAGAVTAEVTVDFSTTALTIGAGLTDYVNVYYDTTDLETDGDTVQVWLDNATAADLSFGVDGAGDYDSQADTLWREDNMPNAYAQTHVNPS